MLQSSKVKNGASLHGRHVGVPATSSIGMPGNAVGLLAHIAMQKVRMSKTE
jgi:hypothetical protein